MDWGGQMKVGSPLGLKRDPHADDSWVIDNKYHLPHPDDPSKELIAGRASELGKTIANTFTLNKYHRRMVAEGMVINGSLRLEGAVARAQDRDEKRRRFNAIADKAQAAASAKEPASKGTHLHEMFQLYDARKVALADVPEPWDLDVIAYDALLRKLGIVMVPELSERIIWVRELNVAGKFDRLVKYLRLGSQWIVLDLKSGFDLSPGWHEIAVQELVYGSANMIFDPETETWSPAPSICADRGLVLHIPSDHDREPRHIATMYEVDLSQTIDLPQTVTPAQLAVAIQEWRKRKVSRVLARVEVTEAGEIIDRPLTWAERIQAAMSDGDLDLVEAECRDAGEWHGGLTTRKRNRSEYLAS